MCTYVRQDKHIIWEVADLKPWEPSYYDHLIFSRDAPSAPTPVEGGVRGGSVDIGIFFIQTRLYVDSSTWYNIATIAVGLHVGDCYINVHNYNFGESSLTSTW